MSTLILLSSVSNVADVRKRGVTERYMAENGKDNDAKMHSAAPSKYISLVVCVSVSGNKSWKRLQTLSDWFRFVRLIG